MAVMMQRVVNVHFDQGGMGAESEHSCHLHVDHPRPRLGDVEQDGLRPTHPPKEVVQDRLVSITVYHGECGLTARLT